MLGRITSRLRAELREERGCPVVVEYGPLAPGITGWGRDLIVVQHPDAGGDETTAPRALGRRFNRALACEVHVYAKASVAGAQRRDHEDRAQRIVGQVLVALDDVLRGGESDGDGELIPGTAYAWEQGSGGFDRGPGGSADGAHYVLPFTIHEAVVDRPFDNSPTPSWELDGISSRTDVYGSTGEGAGETSCGGD